MSFWKNVENELEYQNISRKDLAKRAGFAVSGISLGISNNSVPSADVAVRIAKVLNVSVEYLVTGKNAKNENLTPQMNQLFSNIQKLNNYDLETVSLLVQRTLNK
ncbi:MAG: helix-turn-helix transcriptional regulator [Treponema sp.]|nr:helix-turn-helix transcriptional regulator [Treponema sp.]